VLTIEAILDYVYDSSFVIAFHCPALPFEVFNAKTKCSAMSIYKGGSIEFWPVVIAGDVWTVT
jgi:hypothetical protein